MNVVCSKREEKYEKARGGVQSIVLSQNMNGDEG